MATSATVQPGQPPGGMTRPSEGGALRSQDSRSTADPAGLDGTLLRLNPATGAGMPDNPNAASPDPNTRRIVAQGLRNPFRFTIRPGTNEVWIGDVGWNVWEEINRITNPTASVVNFGWPCYEGTARQSGYDNANVPLCEIAVHRGGPRSAPYYAYNHSSRSWRAKPCPTGELVDQRRRVLPHQRRQLPDRIPGCTVLRRLRRGCIWAMKPSTPGGLPNPGNIETFASAAGIPVDLDDRAGRRAVLRRHRQRHCSPDPVLPRQPAARAAITAAPTAGAVPLPVTFRRLRVDRCGPGRRGPAQLLLGLHQRRHHRRDHSHGGPHLLRAGTYTARLTVTDTLGATGSDDRGDQSWQRRAHGGDRYADGRLDLEGG